MKSAPFALAGFALAVTSVAHAQPTSNLTLYGIVDAYVEVARGAATLTRTQSGGQSGSRFGIKGQENLSGGLRALFTLESGINLDDGTNGQNAFWGRQAFVGISAPYGTLTLGRQYGSVYSVATEFSAFSNVPVGPSTGVIGGFGAYEPVRGGTTTTATGNGGPARVNNSVKLESASFGGFKAGVLLGLGESSGATTQTRVADVYGRYTSGAIDAMLSIVDDRINDGLGVRTVSAGGAYAHDNWRAMAGVISVNDRTDANADGIGWWLGGDYRVRTNLFRAQFLVNKQKHDDGKTQAFGVGYQYDLSKRTNLYTAATRFRNEGTHYAARWSSSLPAGLTTAADRNITQLAVGVRHMF
ncbi:porin [Piscinibacter sp. XHJ-5]|uniref:porin n=1 Tax=Piscinibacter sp. XHJ-5 TaxID=3037797 RepID=UPI0024537051|nr:porin [Piscinibacter sp. XHJ-5]